MTKFTGIPQILAMKRGVSAGNHAYDNERIKGCAVPYDGTIVQDI